MRTLIHRPMEETKEQMKARQKLGKPVQMLEYTLVIDRA